MQAEARGIHTCAGNNARCQPHLGRSAPVEIHTEFHRPLRGRRPEVSSAQRPPQRRLSMLVYVAVRCRIGASEGRALSHSVAALPCLLISLLEPQISQGSALGPPQGQWHKFGTHVPHRCFDSPSVPNSGPGWMLVIHPALPQARSGASTGQRHKSGTLAQVAAASLSPNQPVGPASRWYAAQLYALVASSPRSSARRVLYFGVSGTAGSGSGKPVIIFNKDYRAAERGALD
ncbi:hypothetical protein NDU88_001139 [Pleurodeles waltl]|uniref:Uncharacterized protein n=1 Tax=Pleurodeles waltl TaxID=8319 RepID=A0AAV7NEU3_PLEWA|nr:hypothetical protein NDU88_001139 [Pleurodeles waltl]